MKLKDITYKALARALYALCSNLLEANGGMPLFFDGTLLRTDVDDPDKVVIEINPHIYNYPNRFVLKESSHTFENGYGKEVDSPLDNGLEVLSLFKKIANYGLSPKNQSQFA